MVHRSDAAPAMEISDPPLTGSAAGFREETVEIPSGRFRLVRGGAGEAVVLLHGWPQTWAEWRGVMPSLAAAGFDVIAPNLPGIGGSTNPGGDFSKAAMARGIAALLRALGIPRAHLVGHDIGAMVAYAHAAEFPERVATLACLDAPLPGTPAFDAMRTDPRSWHFAFHNAPEVPERLVTGREAFYVEHFIRGFAGNPDRPDAAAIAACVAAYTDPGTLRAGFEFYRALARDAEDNARLAAPPLAMPVLALNGDRHSGGAAFMLECLRPLARDLDGGLIEGSGHWIPEEQPEALAARLIAHFRRARA